jgi:hypothetical protein
VAAAAGRLLDRDVNPDGRDGDRDRGIVAADADGGHIDAGLTTTNLREIGNG